MIGLVSDWQTDSQLLCRAATGDESAAKALIARLSGPAYSLAWRVLGKREDAQDVVQEALVNLWTAAHQFEGRSALKTYFHQIVLRCCYAHIRNHRETEEYTEEHHDTNVVSDFFSGLVTRDLQRALTVLPSKQRMAVVMWAYFDCTAQDIARVMGVNKNAVDQLLHRAKIKLKALLGAKP